MVVIVDKGGKMERHIFAFFLGSTLTLALFPAGCEPRRPIAAPPETPAIPVSRPVKKEVTDYVDFAGRTDAVQAVDVRARVTGYLTKVAFKEGADVKAGDLLFEIDPRPYKAQLDQATSQVTLAEASLKLARTTYQRDLQIASTVTGGVSQQQLDQDKAAVDEADARLKAYKASTEVYRLNREYTRVTSPIDGRISRYYITVGNLVVQDQTLLTTVVSLDPIYAYFDIDEPTVLSFRRAVNEGRIPRSESGTYPVSMGLQGEEGYPHQGKINFVNNQVNPNTGSISVRGEFANPEPAQGMRLLSPGMFVRIRLPIGPSHWALLVIDRAIGSDQGLKYVYVVGADNTVEQRRITTGALQEDGRRVISSGLKEEDWVVVGGLQLVRPRMQVQVQQIPMPTLARTPSDGARSGSGTPTSSSSPSPKKTGASSK
jgi:multidrug efflux system membrane fusion protein